MKRRVIGFIVVTIIVSLLVPFQIVLTGEVSNGIKWVLFLFFIAVSMIVVKLIFKKDYKYYLLYPLSLVILYIPLNITSGMYVSNGEFRHYSSFPRYEIMYYFVLGLFVLYLFAVMIDRVTNKRFTKFIFIGSDVLSIGIVFITMFATTFVSPHG